MEYLLLTTPYLFKFYFEGEIEKEKLVLIESLLISLTLYLGKIFM